MAIKVNLLPREAAPARAPGISIRAPRIAVGAGLWVQAASVVLVLVVLGLGVMGYLAHARKVTLADDIKKLKAEDEALKRQLTELSAAEQAKAEIKRRIDVIGRVAASQGVPVQVMNGVLRAVPQGIWLTGFEMKPQEGKVRVDSTGTVVGYSSPTLEALTAKRQEAGAGAPAKGEAREEVRLVGFGVVVKGIAFDNLKIADFMENLRRAGTFADVDFVVTQVDRVEQTRVMSFEVTARVSL